MSGQKPVRKKIFGMFMWIGVIIAVTVLLSFLFRSCSSDARVSVPPSLLVQALEEGKVSDFVLKISPDNGRFHAEYLLGGTPSKTQGLVALDGEEIKQVLGEKYDPVFEKKSTN